MKANEAPEKIYLTTFGFPICEPFPQESSCPDTIWSTKPYANADSIEYTRTDAFIEKAAEFLYNYNQKQVLKHGAMATLGYGEYTINVDEFRKYMKGE